MAGFFNSIFKFFQKKSSSSPSNQSLPSETLVSSVPEDQSQEAFEVQNQEILYSAIQNHISSALQTLANSSVLDPRSLVVVQNTEPESLVVENTEIEYSQPENQKSENGVDDNDINTHGGAQDRDYSGVDEEETNCRKKQWIRMETPCTGARKRKSRCADDEPKPVIQPSDILKESTGNMGVSDIQDLNNRVHNSSCMLSSGLPLPCRPEGARSPSYKTFDGELVIKFNPEEGCIGEQLDKEITENISRLTKRDPGFKRPDSSRPPKIYKQLYIPLKEYPGNNFMDPILKRIEKETGAKIAIRSRPSIKGGRLQERLDLRLDSVFNEDLNLLVEADTQEALDAAARMVENLLPVDEVLNERNRKRRRQLAAGNGPIRAYNQYPAISSIFTSDGYCIICGDKGHATIYCPMNYTTGPDMNFDDELQNYFGPWDCSSACDSITTQNSAPLPGLLRVPFFVYGNGYPRSGVGSASQAWHSSPQAWQMANNGIEPGMKYMYSQPDLNNDPHGFTIW